MSRYAALAAIALALAACKPAVDAGRGDAAPAPAAPPTRAVESGDFEPSGTVGSMRVLVRR